MKKMMKFSLDPSITGKMPFYDFRDNHVQNIVGLMLIFWHHSQTKVNQKSPVSVDIVCNSANSFIFLMSNVSGSEGAPKGMGHIHFVLRSKDPKS